MAALAFLFLVLVFGAASWYGYARLTALSHDVTETRAELASTTAVIEANINTARAALQQQSQSVANVEATLGGVQTQVSSVTGTVSDLQKLSSIDPQLLKKYSKVYFLNENYVPRDLSVIPAQYVYDSSKPQQFLTETLPFLGNMLLEAKADGVNLYVDSAYRSFGTQAALKSEYDVTYGAGTANAFSADQGYSEHQLGTAVDLTTTGMGGGLTQAFDQTKAYAWLTNNAYKYGFELSYPKGNGYYVYEPWHWRFVGVKLATYLYTSHQHFYDLDQRVIDAYLINFFDGS